MILLDPMLSDAGTMPPVPLTSTRIRNPLIQLPAKAESLVKNIDAVLITHCHFDHFDRAAENLLAKGTLIFCQPEDEKKLREKGFKNVRAVDGDTEWAGIRLKRFPAHHAEGSLLLSMMGTSSSYLLQASGASLFITGDAIPDNLLIDNLKESRPDVILAYTGQAQMLWGRPITLSAESLKDISKISPRSKIVAVHMYAINHCRLSKAELKEFVRKEKLGAVVAVPDEGEVCAF
jgi:L-ascorbate metabolism protein UlaG (beta-lactamase superfamily)